MACPELRTAEAKLRGHDYDGSGGGGSHPREALGSLVGSRSAAFTTARIALAASAIAVLCGALAAELAQRRGPVAAMTIGVFAMAPAVVPGMLFAIGYYVTFVRIGLVGTEISVVLAHATVALPIAFLFLFTALARYDRGHERVAASLGAGRMQRFVRIRFPLLLPAFSAAFVLAVLTSFEEVVLTLFVAGMDVQTIALRMWAAATQNVGPELAVPGSLLIVMTTVGVICVLAWTSNGNRSRDDRLVWRRA